MSIVAYYCRLSNDQLDSSIKNPEMLQAYSVKELPGAELIDIDQSWGPIAWLVSPRKRLEQHNFALRLNVGLGESLTDDLKRQLKELVRQIEEAEEDLALVAIEGRTDVPEQRLGLGLDGVSVFNCDRVTELSDALARITLEDLKAHYNPELMDREHVFPQHWSEEGNDDMNVYVVPNLERLKEFYANADNEKQAIIVWFE